MYSLLHSTCTHYRTIRITCATFQAIELQRSILELLGIDAEWGCNELNKVRDEYADDQEVMMKMKHFATCAELSCRYISYIYNEDNF